MLCSIPIYNFIYYLRWVNNMVKVDSGANITFLVLSVGMINTIKLPGCELLVMMRFACSSGSLILFKRHAFIQFYH